MSNNSKDLLTNFNSDYKIICTPIRKAWVKFPHWTAAVKVGMLIEVDVTTEIWEIFL